MHQVVLRLMVVALLPSGGGNPRPAWAETPASEQAEPFRLVWSSSAGCRDARVFRDELNARTQLLREARADEHAITLIVETFSWPGGVRGQLTVRKPDGYLTMREVPGATCHEVESAMALIAALMVDPLAANRERSRPPLEARRAIDAQRESEARPEARPTPRRRTAFDLRAEQRLTARTAVAPALTLGQSLGVMLTHRTSDLAPSLGLSGHAARTTTSKPSGSAELSWVAAQLDLCPLGYVPGPRWDLRPCATFQLGTLSGSGFDTPRRAEKSVLWASAGLELEARYELVEPLWLGGEAGLNFPFSRERFYLEPDETLHRIPAWGVTVGAGLGLRFF